MINIINMVSLFLKKVCDDPDCEQYVGIVTIYMAAHINVFIVINQNATNKLTLLAMYKYT